MNCRNKHQFSDCSIFLLFSDEKCFQLEKRWIYYQNLWRHDLISILNGPFIYLGIFHIRSISDFQVMPENFFCGRRPPFPLCNKNIKIIIGEPIEFNLPKLRKMAISMSRDSSFSSVGWPSTSPCGLDEAAQRCLYATISEHIQTVMESLRSFGKTCRRSKVWNRFFLFLNYWRLFGRSIFGLKHVKWKENDFVHLNSLGGDNPSLHWDRFSRFCGYLNFLVTREA